MSHRIHISGSFARPLALRTSRIKLIPFLLIEEKQGNWINRLLPLSRGLMQEFGRQLPMSSIPSVLQSEKDRFSQGGAAPTAIRPVVTNLDQLPLSRLRVFRVRDESVLLDADLAGLYGVETKAFNQAIKRNAHRFPRDFAFQLTEEEFVGLKSQIVTSKNRGGRRYLPWVFTEHGSIMAATILNSGRAVAMSTYVVRAFVRVRRELLGNATLEARLTRIEKDLLSHDAALRTLFGKIKPLLVPPPEPPAKEMGFHTLLKTSQ
jgi:hypothetical protein